MPIGIIEPAFTKTGILSGGASAFIVCPPSYFFPVQKLYQANDFGRYTSQVVAGAVTGLLVLVALLVGHKVDANTGYVFIAAISLVFGAYSGLTFALNNSFIPSGIMTVLSATTLVVVGVSWMNAKKKVKLEAKH